MLPDGNNAQQKTNKENKEKAMSMYLNLNIELGIVNLSKYCFKD
jgi:hypothetical protein